MVVNGAYLTGPGHDSIYSFLLSLFLALVLLGFEVLRSVGGSRNIFIHNY